ncbi:MAG: acyltransferase [Bacteroidota bacterium]
MDLLLEFDKIRPFNDSEVPDAINKIINEEQFKDILSFLYRNKNIDEVIQMFKKIKTVSEFQSFFSHYAVREIIRQTSDGLSSSGINKLNNRKPYLFIANHRDIVLDSAIMQTLLVENKHKTSQITFGSNLMSGDLVVNIGKLNKMFTFYRGGTKIQMYKNALLHSGYIRHVLTSIKESIWIAQRDGRTKDGNDKTQIALIKMLTIGRKDFIPALKELNIVPVTISYEYEPCDAKKVQELYISRSGTYKKQPGEDLNSILKGIKGYKGNIHMTFGTPINSFLDEISEKNIAINELTERIINKIDNQTYENYTLWPGNYIAYDIFRKTNKYSNNKYNQEQKNKFLDYVNTKTSPLQGDKEVLKDMFIHMYAMPVINKTNIIKKNK